MEVSTTSGYPESVTDEFPRTYTQNPLPSIKNCCRGLGLAAGVLVEIVVACTTGVADDGVVRVDEGATEETVLGGSGGGGKAEGDVGAIDFGAAGVGVLVAFFGESAISPLASVPVENRTLSRFTFAARFSFSNWSSASRPAVTAGSGGVEVEKLGAAVGSVCNTPPRHHTKIPTPTPSSAPKRIQRVIWYKCSVLVRTPTNTYKSFINAGKSVKRYVALSAPSTIFSE